MNKIEFKIIGLPVAKGRPRFFKRGNLIGAYTPEETRKWENDIKLQALQFRPEKPIEGAIDMKLIFYLPRPKSLPKKVYWHIKRPDLDNLAKAVKDALEEIFYKNDSQIVRLTLEKWYCLQAPMVEVCLIEYDNIYRH